MIKKSGEQNHNFRLAARQHGFSLLHRVVFNGNLPPTNHRTDGNFAHLRVLSPECSVDQLRTPLTKLERGAKTRQLPPLEVLTRTLGLWLAVSHKWAIPDPSQCTALYGAHSLLQLFFFGIATDFGQGRGRPCQKRKKKGSAHSPIFRCYLAGVHLERKKKKLPIGAERQRIVIQLTGAAKPSVDFVRVFEPAKKKKRRRKNSSPNND